MKPVRTDQESFWAGDFGDSYLVRNRGARLLASNLHFFSRSLTMAREITSCFELGANIGMNLHALRLLYPEMHFAAVEINENAAAELKSHIDESNVFVGSILDYEPKRTYDLVLSKGVLIHQNPDSLDKVYDRMYLCTKSYILIAEYYNPYPVSVEYRGHSERLFKRDFAGEMLRRFPNLILVDYGFSYHLDLTAPQDDITWFLLKKSAKE